jgi:hypothetical protein
VLNSKFAVLETDVRQDRYRDIENILSKSKEMIKQSIPRVADIHTLGL